MNAHADRHIEKEPLSKQVENMLDEARMVLPGIQALLGFPRKPRSRGWRH